VLLDRGYGRPGASHRTRGRVTAGNTNSDDQANVTGANGRYRDEVRDIAVIQTHPVRSSVGFYPRKVRYMFRDLTSLVSRMRQGRFIVAPSHGQVRGNEAMSCLIAKATCQVLSQ
jgi:hypothetical protein